MAAILTTLIGFDGAAGTDPRASLIIDSNGDLFGTTSGSPTPGATGTVFEIAKTAGVYATAPAILANVSSDAGLLADANGDLFGTSQFGGAKDDGTVFEIVKTSDGYASTPTTLASFDSGDGEDAHWSLIADANGDLFGTTEFGGSSDRGMLFEIAKTPTGYASTPTALVSFTDAIGALPQGNLATDANGDLFGVTETSGPNDFGTVFEVAKTAAGYASSPTTLVSFPGPVLPMAGLIADASGNLFGTTSQGGSNNLGTVFEIAKTPTGYASTSTTLVSFTGDDGETPLAGLLIDAAGNLFGTTSQGGSDNLGTVFEIKKTGAGYASTPIVLANFNGTNGSQPVAGLVADANGNLFGTTLEGGPDDVGTVFEITDSGFVPPIPPISPR